MKHPGPVSSPRALAKRHGLPDLPLSRRRIFFAPVMETALNVLLAVLILGGSAFLTQWFTHSMYIRCRNCGTLNARRRTHCRACSSPLQGNSRGTERGEGQGPG